MQGSNAKHIASSQGYNEELIQIVNQGTCNQVFIGSGGNGKIVIRLNNDRDQAEFIKENWCMAKAAMAGVSVPKALSEGVQDGWNFSVQSFEGTVNGKNCEDQSSVWHWLGRSASSFHKIPVKGFGDRLMDGQAGRFDGNWDSYLADNIKAMESDPFLNFLEVKQLVEIQEGFKNLAGRSFDFGLCHGDLKPGNVVVDQSRMTLIDWGCAHAHVVPHFDFRELLRDFAVDSLEVSAFAEGYGIRDKLEFLMPEIKALLLLCAFDVVRWARDCAPAMSEQKEAEFKHFVKRFA